MEQIVMVKGISTESASGRDLLRLKKAARDFEAQLLAELLRQMQAQSSTLPGSEPSAASEQYQAIATQAVAGAMADAGGIGLSKYLVHQLDGRQTIK